MSTRAIMLALVQIPIYTGSLRLIQRHSTQLDDSML